MKKEAAGTWHVPEAIASGLKHEVAHDTPLFAQLADWAKKKAVPWGKQELAHISHAGESAKKQTAKELSKGIDALKKTHANIKKLPHGHTVPAPNFAELEKAHEKIVHRAGKSAISQAKEDLKAARPNTFKDAYVKHIGEPIARHDVNLGAKAHAFTEKHLGTGIADTLFKEKKNIPMASPSGHFTGKQEVEVPSLAAPISKAGKFAVPVLGFMKAQELLEKKKMEKQGSITKADLQKTAAMLISLKDQRNWLEKKARATSILYKQAELGQIEFPKTAAAYEEKVAELIGKDLNVVEEAIKMAAPNFNSYGSLVPDNTGTTPQDTFKRSLMTDF